MSSPMLLILWWLTMAQRVVAAGKVALLIVDVQYCFLSGGSLAVQVGDVVNQSTRIVKPMLVLFWASVADGGPTFNRHWVSASFNL